MKSQRNLQILLLGTGGTIAGLGGEAYQAAQLPIDALVPQLPRSTHSITTEQIAQIDSKDMSFAVWERLWARLRAAMLDVSIDAVVITHGTDTLEETAYFLHRSLPATKPVILTGAMRPADAHDADGPQNLEHALDAVARMASEQTGGVWVVFAGQTLPAQHVQKNHPTRLDAFGSRDSNPSSDLAPQAMSTRNFSRPIQRWPRVEIVMNYAGAGGDYVEILVAQAVDGIVVAGTGNGTMSTSLEAALHAACKGGIAVRLSTRCLQGSVHNNANHDFEVSPLSPVQARIELMLALLSK